MHLELGPAPKAERKAKGGARVAKRQMSADDRNSMLFREPIVSNAFGMSLLQQGDGLLAWSWHYHLQVGTFRRRQRIWIGIVNAVVLRPHSSV